VRQSEAAARIEGERAVAQLGGDLEHRDDVGLDVIRDRQPEHVERLVEGHLDRERVAGLGERAEGWRRHPIGPGLVIGRGGAEPRRIP